MPKVGQHLRAASLGGCGHGAARVADEPPASRHQEWDPELWSCLDGAVQSLVLLPGIGKQDSSACNNTGAGNMCPAAKSIKGTRCLSPVSLQPWLSHAILVDFSG